MVEKSLLKVEAGASANHGCGRFDVAPPPCTTRDQENGQSLTTKQAKTGLSRIIDACSSVGVRRVFGLCSACLDLDSGWNGIRRADLAFGGEAYSCTTKQRQRDNNASGTGTWSAPVHRGGTCIHAFDGSSSVTATLNN